MVELDEINLYLFYGIFLYSWGQGVELIIDQPDTYYLVLILKDYSNKVSEFTRNILRSKPISVRVNVVMILKI